MGEQWRIEHGPHRATIVEVGGGLRDYGLDGDPVLDGFPDDGLPGRTAAGQLLAPWPNRLGDGCYEFDGVRCQVAIDEPELGNALHGLVRWLQWRRVEHTDDSVTVACTLAPQPGYPSALELVTTWSVGPDGLRADHTATNLGPRPAPFGFGSHPYLRVGDQPSAALTLTLPAAERLTIDDRQLPVGTEPVAGTGFDFCAGRPIGDLWLDHTFGALARADDGTFRVTLTGPDGTGAQVWQDAAFRWSHVYTGGAPGGVDGRSVAVEPMTCPPNAFRSGIDLVTLEPGAQWHGSWGITPVR